MTVKVACTICKGRPDAYQQQHDYLALGFACKRAVEETSRAVRTVESQSGPEYLLVG